MNRSVFKFRMTPFICFFAFLTFMAAVPASAQMQDVFDTRDAQKINLYKGDVVTLKVYSLTRIAVTRPGIVELAKVEVNEILLIGQNEGQTSLFVWDEFGKRKIDINVVIEDLDDVIDRINTLLRAGKIRGLRLRKNLDEKKVVITGKVPTDKRATYQRLLDPFLLNVLDLTTEYGDLIQIDVQITELTTTLTKTMGLLWSTGSSGLDFQYQETLPTFDGSLGDWFKIGDFSRTTAIQAAVNMLLAEGKARVLSKPSIIVTAGEAATFLVGGEIPIRTTTVSEGSVSENISYKSYGVDLTVTPTINADKIDLDLSLSIRDVDASNAVGDDTAFTTRSANTKLLLNDGQTIILAGLIKSNKGEQVTRVPFLSKIPIVGLLFRSKNWTPNKEEEVVISLTPTILKDDSQKKKRAYAGEMAGRPKERSPAAWQEPIVEAEVTAAEGAFHPPKFHAGSVTEYAQAVQKKISRAVTFPETARERGWEGVVTLALDILSDGSLVDVTVEESSGYEILDTDAVNTAQLTAPFEAFPEAISLEEIRITLPIIYSQEAVIDAMLWR